MFGKSLDGIKGTCEFKSVYLFVNNEWMQIPSSNLKNLLIENKPGKYDFLGFSLAVKVLGNCKLDFKNGGDIPIVPVLPK